jgi:TPP-dependent trihydroxycyclohexane-1,2-dione (THcHDO) dehydratase
LWTQNRWNVENLNQARAACRYLLGEIESLRIDLEMMEFEKESYQKWVGEFFKKYPPEATADDFKLAVEVIDNIQNECIHENATIITTTGGINFFCPDCGITRNTPW